MAQCKDDLELARKLQEEFDREYEMSLKSAERKEVGTKSRFFRYKFRFQISRLALNFFLIFSVAVEFGFERYRPSYDSDYDLEEELSEDDEDLREIAIDFLYCMLIYNYFGNELQFWNFLRGRVCFLRCYI